MNLAKPEFPQLDGHIAHVVETQVPVRHTAKLPKLKIPPIFSTKSTFSRFFVSSFRYAITSLFALFLSCI